MGAVKTYSTVNFSTFLRLIIKYITKVKLSLYPLYVLRINGTHLRDIAPRQGRDLNSSLKHTSHVQLYINQTTGSSSGGLRGWCLG